MEKSVYEFVGEQTGDSIVEWRKCQVSGQEFPVYLSDQKFYEKMKVPVPTLCPEEREIRRLAWRNERKLYRRVCDASGKAMISIYSQDKPYKVFSSSEWWSDKWNALDSGKEFDFQKPFFEQFEQLMLDTPLLGLIGGNNENSEYVNLTADSKNCYIVIESSNNEDCYHCYWIQKCKNCCDVAFVHQCEFCYEVENSKNCYNLKYSSDCQKCSNSLLLKNCINCEFCFGCVNLNQKKYCVLNKQYTKEQYEKIMDDLYGDFEVNFEKIRVKFNELNQNSVKKYANLVNTENCVGDYLNNAKNCVFCVDGYDAENCKYGEHVWRNAKNLMDVSTVGRDSEWIYEAINCAIGVSYNRFVAVCWGSSNLTYCFNCFNSNNCFGCVGMKNQEYCILNKQYTKEEYEKIVPKIIEKMMDPSTGSGGQKEWGEFFPISISPFAYNETVAQEYFPLVKNEVLEKGYDWLDEKDKDFNGLSYVPLSIENYMEEKNRIELLNGILKCEITGRPFRIVKQELEFYLKHKLSIPRKHPDQRHKERMGLRNSRKLWKRECGKCGKEVLSVYTSTSSVGQLKVFCEECYSKEVY